MQVLPGMTGRLRVFIKKVATILVKERVGCVGPHFRERSAVVVARASFRIGTISTASPRRQRQQA